MKAGLLCSGFRLTGEFFKNTLCFRTRTFLPGDTRKPYKIDPEAAGSLLGELNVPGNYPEGVQEDFEGQIVLMTFLETY
ncbi:hypothetical protein B4U84_29290 [Westiellopsis prolifica IICB1]|nr:hypothetical protein B4U84_29290 [Westiellopsis prolifica IICB1]